jgi:GT2 family glycosyltransferase
LVLPPPLSSSLPVDALPSISIVTPSYNQAAFIGNTIESVLSQNYPKLEYFVQDGGSTDGTVEVLKRHADKLDGWVSEKDGGQSHAINLGFGKTAGEIMAWLNSDDLLLPGALAYVGEYFALHPEVDVIYGNRILIDEEDREIGRWVLPNHDDKVLSWADFIPQETLFWRRSIWEEAGGQIDENFKFAMDWDLLLRFRKAGARMVRLPRFLGAFRIHEAQKTSAVINEVGMAEMGKLRQRELGRTVGQGEIVRALGPYMLHHLRHDIGFRLARRFRG